MSVGQDIQGNVMFPEDTYETGQYQEDEPKPEDKVYNTTVLVEILFRDTSQSLYYEQFTWWDPKMPSFTILLVR